MEHIDNLQEQRGPIMEHINNLPEQRGPIMEHIDNLQEQRGPIMEHINNLQEQLDPIIEHINNLQEQLGPMTWPLLICSLLTAMIITERLFQVMISLGVGKRNIRRKLSHISPTNASAIDSLVEDFGRRRPLLYKGVAMLLVHHSFSKALREDAANMWLQEKQHQLHSGLRLLTLIGVICPLLGLLGTVLGLIDMFKGVAASTSSITPSDLADGLGLAMRTTAAGLVVALPAIAGAQLLGLWADRLISKLEHTLNYVNLWLEGFSMRHTLPEKLILVDDQLKKVASL